MNANPILLKKYSRIIERFAKQKDILLDEVPSFFYSGISQRLYDRNKEKGLQKTRRRKIKW